jgi:hypothetical protein
MCVAINKENFSNMQVNKPVTHTQRWHPDKIAGGCVDTVWTEEANRKF